MKGFVFMKRKGHFFRNFTLTALAMGTATAVFLSRNEKGRQQLGRIGSSVGMGLEFIKDWIESMQSHEDVFSYPNYVNHERQDQQQPQAETASRSSEYTYIR
jgi:hypothetical protein